MRKHEMIKIGDREYRKFIPFPEVITDGTHRCIRCGQIDEEDYHDHDLCVAAFDKPAQLPVPEAPPPRNVPFVEVFQHRFRYHVSNARGWSDWSKWQEGPAAHPGTEFVQVEERVLYPVPVAPPEATLPTWAREKLTACKAAIDAYGEALERREHGGLAASRCSMAIEKIFYPERYQPVGAARPTNEEN